MCEWGIEALWLLQCESVFFFTSKSYVAQAPWRQWHTGWLGCVQAHPTHPVHTPVEFRICHTGFRLLSSTEFVNSVSSGVLLIPIAQIFWDKKERTWRTCKEIVPCWKTSSRDNSELFFLWLSVLVTLSRSHQQGDTNQWKTDRGSKLMLHYPKIIKKKVLALNTL